MQFERTNVVFVVENSCTFKKYVNELMEAYINPTTSYFSGGLSEEDDVYFTQNSLVQYAAVFFGCELNMLSAWGDIDVVGPTSSEKEILSSIQNAEYSSKNSTRQGFIAEGLNTAATLFKTLDTKRNSEASRKCCILLTQSAPFIHNWGNITLDKTLKQFSMANIKLSIISPHKLHELHRLFELAGGDVSVLNFATKAHHQVLLNGYTLKERAPMVNQPVAPAAPAMNQAIVSSASGQNNPLGHPIPSPNTSVGSPSQQNPQQPNIQSQQTQQTGMVRPQQNTGQMNMNQQQNPTMNIQNQQNPGGIVRPGQPGHMIPGTLPRMRWPNINSGMMQQPPMNQNPQQQSQQGQGQQQANSQQQQPQQAQGQQQQPNSQANTSMNPNQPGANCNMGIRRPLNYPNNNAINPISMASGNKTRPMLWQGTLEWCEMNNDMQRQMQHQVKCAITLNNYGTPEEPDFKTDGWPSTLMMQLIAKNVLSSMGNTYFQNVHTVIFEPEASPALDVLTQCICDGMAGCIFLNSPNTDVKVIILLFSQDKGAYVGFIPIDQMSFYTKIRSKAQINQNQRMGKKPQPQAALKCGVRMNVPGQTPGTSSAQNMQNLSNTSGGGIGQIGMHPGNVLLPQNPGITTQRPGTAGMNSGLMAGGQVTTGRVMNPSSSQNMLGTPFRLQQPLQQQQNQQQQNQQQLHHQNDIIMRPNPGQQQLQLPLQQQQQRPMPHGQVGGLGNPRMQQPQMQNQGLRQLLATRLQPNQQQQQQHQLMMMQQQGGMRAQMSQGQVLGQQQMNQQGLNQHVINQQGMGQQGLGQDEYPMELL